jgi:hypothetical protein
LCLDGQAEGAKTSPRTTPRSRRSGAAMYYF